MECEHVCECIFYRAIFPNGNSSIRIRQFIQIFLGKNEIKIEVLAILILLLMYYGNEALHIYLLNNDLFFYK